MGKVLILEVDKQGKMKSETFGVVGKECDELLDRLKKMGTQTFEYHKDEYCLVEEELVPENS